MSNPVTAKPCPACNGAGSVWVPNPVPPPQSILVTCGRCNGTGNA